MIELFVGHYSVIFFEVFGWSKMMLIKYYSKMRDVDKEDPFKHSKWSAPL